MTKDDDGVGEGNWGIFPSYCFHVLNCSGWYRGEQLSHLGQLIQRPPLLCWGGGLSIN